MSHDPSVYTHVLKGPRVCTTTKTKELSKQVRDKVVEKYRLGLGYKKTSETLNILQSTIKSIIKNGKNMAPQQTCQERAAHKLTDQARRELIREAAKRPKITLKEHQSLLWSFAESTFYRFSLQKSGQKKAIA